MAGPAFGGGGLRGGGGLLGGPPLPLGGRAGVGESFSPGLGARAGGPSNTGESLCKVVSLFIVHEKNEKNKSKSKRNLRIYC